jgi:hypothetical protein
MSWANCKDCGKKIFWTQMPGGNWLPMNPDSGGLHDCVEFDSSSGGKTTTRNSTPTSVGHASSYRGEPLTHPTLCAICGEEIFFHTNGNGDVVFFDELGWPWPKHRCLSNDDKIKLASRSNHPMNDLLKMRFRPTQIAYLHFQDIREFDESLVGKTVVGLVLTINTKSAWLPKPNSYSRQKKEVLTTAIRLAGDTRPVRIYFETTPTITVGELMKITTTSIIMDNKRVLLANDHKVVIAEP